MRRATRWATLPARPKAVTALKVLAVVWRMDWERVGRDAEEIGCLEVFILSLRVREAASAMRSHTQGKASLNANVPEVQFHRSGSLRLR